MKPATYAGVVPAKLHDDRCTTLSAGWGSGCDCRSGQFEERQTVLGDSGVIVSVFRRQSDAAVRFVVERTSDGRLGIFSAEELG